MTPPPLASDVAPAQPDKGAITLERDGVRVEVRVGDEIVIHFGTMHVTEIDPGDDEMPIKAIDRESYWLHADDIDLAATLAAQASRPAPGAVRAATPSPEGALALAGEIEALWNGAKEQVRHERSCPGILYGDVCCECGAVAYLDRFEAALPLILATLRGAASAHPEVCCRPTEAQRAKIASTVETLTAGKGRPIEWWVVNWHAHVDALIEAGLLEDGGGK